MALKKTCSCGVLIDYTQARCSKCEAEKLIDKKELNRQYDRYTRNAEATKFYHRREWSTVSNVVRLKFNGMCARCWANSGEMVSVDVVHHIVEISDDWDKRLYLENLVCLCHSCHNEIHGLMNRSEMDKQRVVEELKSISDKWNK